ncbi:MULTISPECIES: DUF5655 domain-containing protein [Micrococcaceae]|uniref:DUF5655 domain-containing protein n=1 Tax=Micrococcaceae TaxID=1268 RepID=UPI0006FE9559|nr:DUF5655 domain-containing protein [Arthrobacter sp. Leaf137]KQQ85442.1 hypothetical protein ASF64_04790 [Arthrobacter sp. Leaf137]MDQ1055792.1 hypothetical protein [Arthrobacter sp. SORGH_AS_0212]
MRPEPGCGPWTVERFFAGSPDALAVYGEVSRIASSFGDVEVRASKSQVAFRRRRGFAYLWLPGMYLRSAVAVVLSLALPFESASPRFKEIAHPSPSIWMHHIEITDASQVDAAVAGWMRQAYDFAA